MSRPICLAGRAIALLGATSWPVHAASAQGATQQSGFCAVAERPVTGPLTTLYVSATFTTAWPVIVSLESRFQSFVESKYHTQVSRRGQCWMGPTLEWAKGYREKVLPTPPPGNRLIETGWTPDSVTRRAGSPP